MKIQVIKKPILSSAKQYKDSNTTENKLKEFSKKTIITAL
jgi:hypothetical protein